MSTDGWIWESTEGLQYAHIFCTHMHIWRGIARSGLRDTFTTSWEYVRLWCTYGQYLHCLRYGAPIVGADYLQSSWFAESSFSHSLPFCSSWCGFIVAIRVKSHRAPFYGPSQYGLGDLGLETVLQSGGSAWTKTIPALSCLLTSAFKMARKRLLSNFGGPLGPSCRDGPVYIRDF